MLRDFRQPLTGVPAQGVELPARSDTGDGGELGQQHHKPAGDSVSTAVEVINSQWQDRAVFGGLLLAMVIPSLTVVVVVGNEWLSSPSQRGWLVVGFGFYIVAALKALWGMFVQVYERMLYLRVEVHRLASPTLFEAITSAIQEKSEQFGHTCSWGQEARLEHDKVTGGSSVKLRFWSSATRNMVVNLHDVCGRGEAHAGRRLPIRVVYRPGDEVTLGRDPRQERRETLSLSVRTSQSLVLADKKRLCRWLGNCYTAFMKPADGAVQIYALQESSTDWVPEWAFERAKPVKNTSGTGHSFS